jgi:hypothetical protein
MPFISHNLLYLNNSTISSCCPCYGQFLVIAGISIYTRTVPVLWGTNSLQIFLQLTWVKKIDTSYQ